MRSSDSIPFVEEIVIENTKVSLFDSNKNHSDNEENDNQIEENIIKLQNDYKLPTFPDDLQFVVDQNDLTKLARHSYFRKVLLNLIYNDIANKHQLLYPKAQDYLIITKAVLRSLNIPVDNQNVLDPISPTPCIKMLDDKYELYLDYELIVQTTSAQEAISILLSLYNIFEVKFARHSRGVHLLYAIMFQDQNELTKPLRNLLVSWEYTIKNKLVVRQHLSTITATTLNNSNITQSTISMQSNENGLDVVEKVDSIQNQTINDMDQESVTNHSLNHAPALVVKENPIVISTTSKNESMHSKKQSSQPVVDENIFETIEYSSLNIEPVTKASQRPKKRKPTTSHEHITRS
ncbi:unnamed protein product [Adineta steineri]|uniref:Uncharacterized protein n=1 Tax=Adineta steineri TaxID=433720 RepID=A0A814I9D5_9BILA|nr:unnamed protein product [Adineta steineri]